MHVLQNHFRTALMATPDGLSFAHLHDAIVPWVWPMIGVAVAFEIGCYLLIQRRAYPWREMLSSAAVYVRGGLAEPSAGQRGLAMPSTLDCAMYMRHMELVQYQNR